VAGLLGGYMWHYSMLSPSHVVPQRTGWRDGPLPAGLIAQREPRPRRSCLVASIPLPCHMWPSRDLHACQGLQELLPGLEVSWVAQEEPEEDQSRREYALSWPVPARAGEL
jgi:hypothetical protein